MEKIEEIDKIVHELVKHAQAFHSHSLFLQNKDKEKTIRYITDLCDRCAKHCYEIRQLILTKENTW